MNPIRILAVDDDLDFRYLLTQMLLGQPDLELAAVCATAQEGCAAVARLQPDIVLMDLELIGSYTDGADAARRIRMQTTARVLIRKLSSGPVSMPLPQVMCSKARLPCCCLPSARPRLDRRRSRI